MNINEFFNKPKYKGPMNPKELIKIVARVEKRLAQFIIYPTNTVSIKPAPVQLLGCKENCSCVRCFHIRLDLLLKTSTEATDLAIVQGNKISLMEAI